MKLSTLHASPATPAAPCPVEAYARAVLAGVIVAGRYVKLACERHLRDLEQGHDRGLYWDAAAALHAIRFFPFLCHSKGEWAGKPLSLEPWQKFIVGSIYGWKRADGTRRFRSAYVQIARKNGKSTLASGVATYSAVADCEPGAEVYCAATTKGQAKIVFEECCRMVRKSPLLKKRLNIFKNNISCPGTNSKIEPVSGDATTLDGLNVSCAIVDELHAHPTRELLDVLVTATGARRQPLILCITTSGFDRSSCCWQEREHGAKILEGVFQASDGDSYFLYIAEIDPDDDWRNPACWGKANPNLGVSVSLDDLKAKAAKAAEVPAYQASFLRLHLNVWTEGSVRAIDPAAWLRCKGPLPILRGLPCFGGLDLGSTCDLTTLVLLWPLDEKYILKAWFWCPREAAKRRERRDRALYDTWARQGLIELTEGESLNYGQVRKRVNEINAEFPIAKLAGDRLFQGDQLLHELRDQDGFEVEAFGQGYFSMAAPTKRFLEMIASGKVLHDGNAVLDWMASNLVTEQDPAGNLKPSKKVSREKIDGMVGAIMATGLAMAAGDLSAGGGYESW
jgi:phage terminase large subunit-like protein